MILRRHKYQLGEKRTVRRFAWRPVRITDELVVLLGWYFEELERKYYGKEYWEVLRRWVRETDAVNRLGGQP